MRVMLIMPSCTYFLFLFVAHIGSEKVCYYWKLPVEHFFLFFSAQMAGSLDQFISRPDWLSFRIQVFTRCMEYALK